MSDDTTKYGIVTKKKNINAEIFKGIISGAGYYAFNSRKKHAVSKAVTLGIVDFLASFAIDSMLANSKYNARLIASATLTSIGFMGVAEFRDVSTGSSDLVYSFAIPIVADITVNFLTENIIQV